MTQISTDRPWLTQITPQKRKRSLRTTLIRLWCSCDSWTKIISRFWALSIGLRVSGSDIESLKLQNCLLTVHATSMNNTNKFVSSDNVGFASLMLEKEYNHDNIAGKGNFVGAFCSANLGDVSPNIMGPKCQKTGLPCDPLTSSCPDKDLCVASGPGKDIFESTKIIGSRIYKGASKLLNSKVGREVTGGIHFIHQFIDVPKQSVTYFNQKQKIYQNGTGCLPAMG